MQRCFWCHTNNPLYIAYHDKEWGVPNFDDTYLWEMLLLESFQAGLSWECVLNKRQNFRLAFDNFNVDKIAVYNDYKIKELMNNQGIIRHQLKIKSAINNAKIFQNIQKEYGSFYAFLKTILPQEIIYETGKTHNVFSDKIAHDLQKKGMKFIGTTIIYAYLQAVGFIYSHEKECFLFNSALRLARTST
ncbi:MAG: DNA-3-methyladenine glycosylase I [Neisseriaceae bacterium]|nr:DNA-3-methyladenine glycosylase I [Neisseriaceae bacterium]MBR3424977.1 DNA-3-methyladenine glycosylase I [Neisseriaceae bacterium]